jgi:hypothetical protein
MSSEVSDFNVVDVVTRVMKLLPFNVVDVLTKVVKLQTSAVASDVDRSRLVKLIVEDTLHAALALQHGAGPGSIGHLGRSLAVEVRVKAGGASTHGGGVVEPSWEPSHLKKRNVN